MFDLDGVLTHTAVLHEEAWRRAFATLDQRPLSHADYQAFVDGKPRLDGVRGFLASRGLTLPEGTLADPPGAFTVRGIARSKNAEYAVLLRERGPGTDPSALKLVRQLKEAGVRVGVASSSRNTEAVLRAARLFHLFEARVDGVVSAELGLRGKPAPDIFLECARRLGAQPSRSVVVEDAAAGVEAGVAGGFGLVIGVDTGGNRERLAEAGAHWIVTSLAEVSVEAMRRLVRTEQR